MKKNVIVLFKYIFLVFCSSLFFVTFIFPSIDFANRSSNIVLSDSNSKVAYTSTTFGGWAGESIVRDSGGENLKENDRDSSGLVTWSELLTTGKAILIYSGILTPLIIRDPSFVASPIDLSGGLTLYADQRWYSGTTISAGGRISAHGKAIILGDDLLLPDNFDIRFTTSAIIDGQGHSWIFGHNSRISVDNYVTVTLRNINLQSVRNHSDGSASINILGPWRSNLVFQNTQIQLDDNFSFTQGKMFIHGDVKVSGTSQFNYTSTQASWIKKDSTFKFDLNSTFSYGPVEAGWVPTGDEGRRLIMMEDRTSQLFLNGATLRSTTTGLILVKGTCILDHKNFMYNEDGTGAGATSLSESIAFIDGTNYLNVEIMPSGSIEAMSGLFVI